MKINPVLPLPLLLIVLISSTLLFPLADDTFRPLNASTIEKSDKENSTLLNPSHYFTEEEMKTWKGYQQRKLWQHLISLGAFVSFYLFLILTGFNRSIKNLALRATTWCYQSPGLNRIGERLPPLKKIAKMPEILFGGQQGVTVIFYCLIFVFLVRLFFFPYSFYRSYYFELQHGLSNYSLGLWLLDYIKGLMFSIPTMAMMAFGIYGLINRAGNKWWLLLWVSVSILAVGYAYLSPYKRHIYNRFEPLEAGELRQKIEYLMTEQEIPIDDIFVVDASKRSKRVNAYFEGVGNTQRIVLYDNLIDQFTPREITMILAHETAHWKKPHKNLSFLLFSVTLFCILGLANKILYWGTRIRRLHYSSPLDIAGLPVLLFTFFLMFQIIRPFNLYKTRINERDADRQAFEMVCDPQAFIDMQVKLMRLNHLDINPHPLTVTLFYSHPPFIERVKTALTIDCEEGIQYKIENENPLNSMD